MNMLWAGRIISWIVVVTGGLTWTVGQAGLDSTDKNLCEFASAIWHAPIHNCHIVPLLMLVWQIGAALALLFLIFDFFRWLKSRKPSGSRAKNQEKEIGLLDMLWWVAERSAWGRLQSTRRRWPDEQSKLVLASSVVRTEAMNGDLPLRGRLKDSVEYKDVDRDLWRTAYIGLQPDNASIWKAVVLPLAGETVQIPDYDRIIAERNRVETLWPKHEWKYDWRRIWLSFKSKFRAEPPMSDLPNQQGEPQPRTEKTEPESSAPKTPIVRAPVEVPAPAPAPTEVTARAPKNWEQLFAIGDDSRSVWLRFLPDTKHYRADTLVLIVYGQKVLLDVPRIRIEAAHAAVEKTVQNAPNRPKTSSGFLAAMIAVQQIQAAANLDWVDECVPLYLERVGLSRGGFYQLTEDGERRAAGLAYDLIRRA